MTRVVHAGAKHYKEELATSGFIPGLKYNHGDLRVRHMLKVAKDVDGNFQFGKLPSWVYFEEVTGVKPMTPIGEDVGEYNYDTKLSAVDNIMNCIESAKGNQERMVKVVNSNFFIALVAPEIENRDNVIIESYINNPDQLRVAIEEHMKDFIKQRTDLLVLYANTIATKVPGTKTFRSGTLPPEEEDGGEAIKTGKNLFRLANTIITNRFKKENPSLMPDSKPFKDAIRDYRSENMPIQKPSLQGLMFAADAKVTDNYEIVKDQYGNEFTLGYYDLGGGQGKLDKINAKKPLKGVDTQLDVLSLLFCYNSGSDKKEAGQKMQVDRFDEPAAMLTPEKVHDMFVKTLSPKSYTMCYKFNDYDIREVAQFMATWFNTENAESLLTTEDIDTNKEILELIGAQVTSANISDVVSSVLGNPADIPPVGAVNFGQPPVGQMVPPPVTEQPQFGQPVNEQPQVTQMPQEGTPVFTPPPFATGGNM